MQEHRYYSDAMANYIILQCPKDAREDYQYRMLAVNHIQGLLPCIHRVIDGEEFLYYNITSRQSVARIYDHKEMEGGQLHRLLYAAANMIQTLSVYLLDPGKLLLNPEYIFYDYSTDEYCFVYYPEEQRHPNYSELFEYLSERAGSDNMEEKLVIYHLCELACNDSFLLKPNVLDQEYEQVKGDRDTESSETPNRSDLLQERECAGRRDNRKDSEKMCSFSDDSEEFNDIDDLDGLDDQEDKKAAGKRKRAKGKKKKQREGSTEKNGKGGNTDYVGGNSPMVALVLAVLFTMGTIGLFAASMTVQFSKEQLFTVRAGMTFSLIMTILSAVYGVIGSWKKSRAEIVCEEEKEINERRNAMRKTEEA